jgi:hypothetical protein
MSANSFAARRRTARSTVPFHLLAFPSIFLLLLLFWHSRTSPTAETHHTTRSKFQGIPTTEVTLRGQQEVVTQDKHQQEIIAGSPLNPNMRIPNSQSLRPSIPLRIISFNIRYATETPVLGEQPWAVRGPKLCRQLIFTTEGHDSPFICLQEVLHSQVQDIQERLGDSWSHIGRGREEKATDGEFSPVFYRSDTWKCIKNETKWLSDTPGKPSKGWDAVLNRIVTMGLFVHKHNGVAVIVMSTHVSIRQVASRI